MRYTQFGNIGAQVSRLSMGAMTFPNELSIDDSQKILDEAIDNGVNLIDTADSYGKSEEVLGQILPSEKRERVFLATKVFRRFCRDQRLGRNSRVNIINSLHRSLKLMKTDYVDLYQLHHPDESTPVEETIATLDTLVKEGKIRYWGVSNHYAWQMAQTIGEAKMRHLEPLVSLQASYDILDRQIEMETTAFLKRYNVALMCYGPLCGGILTGKYQGMEDSPPEDTRAAQNEKVRKYLEDDTVRTILDQLESVSQDVGMRMNQVAVLWLLSKDYVSTVLMGGSKAKHFQELYDIADESLPEDVIAAIDEWSTPRVYSPFKNQPEEDGAPLAQQR